MKQAMLLPAFALIRSLDLVGRKRLSRCLSSSSHDKHHSSLLDSRCIRSANKYVLLLIARNSKPLTLDKTVAVGQQGKQQY
jgi:hypothetical protein